MKETQAAPAQEAADHLSTKLQALHDGLSEEERTIFQGMLRQAQGADDVGGYVWSPGNQRGGEGCIIRVRLPVPTQTGSAGPVWVVRVSFG